MEDTLVSLSAIFYLQRPFSIFYYLSSYEHSPVETCKRRFSFLKKGTRYSGNKLSLYADSQNLGDDIVHTIGNNRLICKAAKSGVAECRFYRQRPNSAMKLKS